MRTRARWRLGPGALVGSRGFDLLDNRFDTVSLLSVIKIVEELAEADKPSVVLTHHPGDLNVDPVSLRSGLTAFRSRRAGAVPGPRRRGALSTDYSAGVPGRAFERTSLPVSRKTYGGRSSAEGVLRRGACVSAPALGGGG